MARELRGQHHAPVLDRCDDRITRRPTQRGWTSSRSVARGSKGRSGGFSSSCGLVMSDLQRMELVSVRNLCYKCCTRRSAAGVVSRGLPDPRRHLLRSGRCKTEGGKKQQALPAAPVKGKFDKGGGHKGSGRKGRWAWFFCRGARPPPGRSARPWPGSRAVVERFAAGAAAPTTPTHLSGRTPGVE